MVVRVEPLFQLVGEKDIMRLCLNLSHHSPTAGGGIMRYHEALAMSTREALELGDLVIERGNDEIRRMVKLHGG